ncbi:M23 family metallopeptidase [Candidatus Microgenomates bacterium]|nr:M23 family metallopeptidase [Candidatus Microgenomates bacterium]
MTDQDFSNKKNINSLTFRDLSNDPVEEELDESKDQYIFVDDEIVGNKFFLSLKRFFLKIYTKKRSRHSILGFFFSFTDYIFLRGRVILVLLSVLLGIFLDSFNGIKDNLTKRMFWGRGSFLKSALQVVFVTIVFILTISYLYRRPVVIVASDVPLDEVGVAESDVMVLNASVNTLIPKDRERRSVEEYIVKGGDTVASIAKYYEISTETLLWANNMSSSGVIKPGQKLEIPPSDGVLVVVSKGDTLASLAKKYSASEQAIADFNWLDYPFTLEVSSKLFIPEGKMPATVRTYASSSPSFAVKNQYTKTATSTTGGDSKVGRFLSWPVAGRAGIISQYYKGYYHTGIDIADRSLPKIVSAASGTVIFAGCAGYCPPLGSTYGGSGYAWAIQVDHGNGYSTWYAHLKNIYVKSGQKVSAGQVIGQMGSTGRSTGPHVHFELRKNNSHINPIYYTNW